VNVQVEQLLELGRTSNQTLKLLENLFSAQVLVRDASRQDFFLADYLVPSGSITGRRVSIVVKLLAYLFYHQLDNYQVVVIAEELFMAVIVELRQHSSLFFYLGQNLIANQSFSFLGLQALVQIGGEVVKLLDLGPSHYLRGLPPVLLPMVFTVDYWTLKRQVQQASTCALNVEDLIT